MTRFGFLGAVDFSRRTLEALLAAGADVAVVLTSAAEHRGINADWVDLGEVAAAHQVPCFRLAPGEDASIAEHVRSHGVDVLLVFGWSRLLPAGVLAAPPQGCFGTHPTLLPERRGRHPITWALVEGAAESGLTVLQLVEDADAGDIIWQRAFPIALDDDAASVYEKVCALGCSALRELLPRFEAGTIERIPQDHARATHRRRRTDDDRIIRWEESSMTVYNLIRGLARPYLGATTSAAGTDILVWRALPPAGGAAAPAGALPGTVLAADGGALHVATGDGVLVLTEVTGLDAVAIVPGTVLGAAA